jgi:hypothetical protein
MVMQGSIQSLRTARGCGWMRDVPGSAVLWHHTALPSPGHVAALTRGMVGACEAEPSPQGLRAITVARLPAPR